MNDGKFRFQYFKVYQDLKDQIQQGEVRPGEKLLTEKELMQKYQVSRDTIRKALSKLEQEGFIKRKSALGTFVKQAKSDYELSNLKSFSEQMRSRGIVPSSELERIELKSLKDPKIISMLNLEKEDKCYLISRIRKGDGVPMAYETAYVPYKLCPDIQKHLDDQASLYEVYENIYHHQIGVATIRLEAEIPSAKLQEKLNLFKESPILLMECQALLADGQPLYYVECAYIGEKYFFSTKISRI